MIDFQLPRLAAQLTGADIAEYTLGLRAETKTHPYQEANPAWLNMSYLNLIVRCLQAVSAQV